MFKRTMGTCIFIAATTLLPASAKAYCQWTINGRLQVTDTETEIDSSNNRNLAGIEVRIQESIFSAGDAFIPWSTTGTTNSAGRFSFERNWDCFPRRFQVEVRFNNSELRVNQTETNEWMRVYRSSTRRSAGTLDIGTKRFSASASGVLSNRDNVRRAVTWYMIKRIIDRLKAEDPFVEFNQKIRVAYPANVISDSSYANAVDNTAYIHSQPGDDEWDVDTIIHEVMHLWNFQHSTGLVDWWGAVIDDNTTHGFQEDPNVAFHEGFAEWAKNEIMYHLWGRDKKEPRSRYWLGDYGLDNFDILERNDKGVRYALSLLSSEDVYALRFGSASNNSYGDSAVRLTAPMYCPASPDVSFWQLLEVFDAHPSAGWNTDWQVGNAEYGVWRFFDRAADILPNLSADDTAMFMDLLDVSKTSEPSSYCLPQRL